ncbi:MAG: cupin domain-containing protein [Hyphomonadaceae bacterium]|nr:cupin domain-containing protein [Hyphomonadaceae bacterium]
MSSDIYDAFMLDHAAGALPAGLHLAADLHVALSATGAEAATIWDMIGGALLEHDEAVTVDKSSLGGPRKRSASPDIRVRDILDTDLGRLRWRPTLTRAYLAPTGVRGANYMRLDAGKFIPRHGHSVMEATVVLSGQLQVQGTIFDVGDLMLGVPGQDHRPGAYGDEPCVCVVAHEDKPFWRFS